MARIAVPTWFSSPGRAGAGLSRHFLAAMAVVLALVVAALLWTKWGSRGEAELGRLSPAQRAALYDRTLADLELCAGGAGKALADHCAHQAELILKFSECDASCQSLARPWQGTPTR